MTQQGAARHKPEMGRTMQATFKKLTASHDDAKVAKFIAKEIRSMERLRANGHRDFVRMTDEGIRSAAGKLASIYNIGQVLS